MIAFDLDPGPPATIVECAQVALELRRAFDHLGLEAFAKTSGSKGMQVYLPLEHAGHLRGHARVLARAGAAARAARPEARRVGHEQGQADGQGVRRLEPERPPQDDGQRLLAARDGAADGVDAADLGRGRRRWRTRTRRSRSRRTRCWSGWRRWATCSRRSRRSSRSFRASRQQRAPVVGRQPGRLGARRRSPRGSRRSAPGRRGGACGRRRRRPRTGCPASPRAPRGRGSIGMIESRSPHTISVGSTAARWRRSRALTRWPEGSITERTVCRNACARALAVQRGEAAGEHGEVAVGRDAPEPERLGHAAADALDARRGQHAGAPSRRPAARRRAAAGGPRGRARRWRRARAGRSARGTGRRTASRSRRRASGRRR